MRSQEIETPMGRYFGKIYTNIDYILEKDNQYLITCSVLWKIILNGVEANLVEAPV
jgi:hypothetical protein